MTHLRWRSTRPGLQRMPSAYLSPASPWERVSRPRRALSLATTRSRRVVKPPTPGPRGCLTTPLVGLSSRSTLKLLTLVGKLGTGGTVSNQMGWSFQRASQSIPSGAKEKQGEDNISWWGQERRRIREEKGEAGGGREGEVGAVTGLSEELQARCTRNRVKSVFSSPLESQSALPHPCTKRVIK
jgi:hypothetical protein